MCHSYNGGSCLRFLKLNKNDKFSDLLIVQKINTYIGIIGMICMTYISVWPIYLYDLYICMTYISVWPIYLYDLYICMTYISVCPRDLYVRESYISAWAIYPRELYIRVTYISVWPIYLYDLYICMTYICMPYDFYDVSCEKGIDEGCSFTVFTKTSVLLCCRYLLQFWLV